MTTTPTFTAAADDTQLIMDTMQELQGAKTITPEELDALENEVTDSIEKTGTVSTELRAHLLGLLKNELQQENEEYEENERLAAAESVPVEPDPAEAEALRAIDNETGAAQQAELAQAEKDFDQIKVNVLNEKNAAEREENAAEANVVRAKDDTEYEKLLRETMNPSESQNAA